MDTTVTGIGSVVVAELRAAGYLESTIGQYARTIKVLARFAAGRGSDYSPELGAEFASMTVSPRTGRFSAQRRMDYGRLTRVFDSYVRTGRVDLSVRTRGGGGPRPATAALAALGAAWEAEMAGRGLAAATREAYGRVARGYLVFLEQRGISDLGEADGGSSQPLKPPEICRGAPRLVEPVWASQPLLKPSPRINQHPAGQLLTVAVRVVRLR